VPTTLRARLTAWNAGAFAVLLAALGAGSYGFVSSTVEARTDGYLRQTAETVGETLARALAADPPDSSAVPGAPGTPPAPAADPAAAARAVLDEFRYRDIGAGVFDATPGAPGTPRVLAASAAPGAGPERYPLGGPWGVAAVVPAAARAVREGTVVSTLGAGPSAERVVATSVPVRARAPGGPTRVYVVAVSQSLGGQHEVLREAREALVAGGLLALALVGAGGYLVAWRALSPVYAMGRRAERIEAGTLHERLPAPGAEELARLGAAFNGLLARLERAFEQQRRFMADASHELRTPVAVVRGEAELALAQAHRPEAEYRAALGTVGAQAEQMARLVDDLFLLARADAGERPVVRGQVYLEEVAEACVAAVRSLAARQGVALHFVPDAELPVAGDERLLRRMLLNLLDNAIKYTPAGGRVEVAAARLAGAPAGPPTGPPTGPPPGPADFGSTAEYEAVRAAGGGAPAAGPAGAAAAGPRARLTVRDTGRGIPAEAQPHVFERFYRARAAADGDGAARHAAGPGDGSGAGLGLSIVAWVAEAHGGAVALVRSGAGGTEFAVELPLATDGEGDAGAAGRDGPRRDGRGA
jgi:signal transduction histidine kinase